MRLNPGYISQEFVKNWDDKELNRNIDSLSMDVERAKTLLAFMIEELDRRVAAGTKL